MKETISTKATNSYENKIMIIIITKMIKTFATFTVYIKGNI